VGGGGRRAVAELRMGACDRREQTPGRGHLAPGQRSARADHDRVRRRIAPERVGRTPGGDTEPSSLARGETPEALVRADRLARFVDDAALAPGQPVPLEEVAVVAAAQEARLLALRATSNRKPRALGLGASLLLRLLAERKPEPLEVARIERREHVRLILVRVDGASEQRPAPMLDDPRVVAGGEARRPSTPGEREQLR